MLRPGPATDHARRWCGLRAEPLAEVDDWLAPYRWMWESRLDRLGHHLDTMPEEGDADVVRSWSAVDPIAMISPGRKGR